MCKRPVGADPAVRTGDLGTADLSQSLSARRRAMQLCADELTAMFVKAMLRDIVGESVAAMCYSAASKPPFETLLNGGGYDRELRRYGTEVEAMRGRCRGPAVM